MDFRRRFALAASIAFTPGSSAAAGQTEPPEANALPANGAVDVSPYLTGNPDLDHPVYFDDTPVGDATELDRYVHEFDPSFAWRHEASESSPGATTHLLRLTSQTWRTEADVSHPEWTHWLRIVVPDRLDSRTALLIIDGGRRRPNPPRAGEELTTGLAALAGSIVVHLDNVPNQPTEVNRDGRRRFEDDLIAETWNNFIETEDPRWVLQLPMVKSAVSAMTAAEEFLAAPAPEAHREPIELDGFTVAGASKRGWTTWLTAAVDDRVRAICPLVIDTLNLPRTIRHHWGAYGFWAPAIHDYAERNLAPLTATAAFRDLRELVDPYLYRGRLNMPKFLLNSAGDEFFLPDTSQYYAPDLPGETRLRYVPNTEHDLAGSIQAITGAVAFHKAAVEGRKIPTMEWRIVEGDLAARGPGNPIVIEAHSDTRPAAATLWVADNTEARDFRLEAIGPAWQGTDLEVVDRDGTHAVAARIEQPQEGWRAALIEFTLPVEGQSLAVVFSTEVFVVPDVLPFRDTPME